MKDIVQKQAYVRYSFKNGYLLPSHRHKMTLLWCNADYEYGSPSVPQSIYQSIIGIIVPPQYCSVRTGADGH